MLSRRDIRVFEVQNPGQAKKRITTMRQLDFRLPSWIHDFDLYLVEGGHTMHFSSKVIHYTDYAFQQFCNENYGINRGVYNTIEGWFYTKGIKNITRRRQAILAFLEFTAADFHHLEQRRIRFGSGRLVMKLNEYWREGEYTK